MNVGAEPSARSKRSVILRVAAQEFGRHGFDATKWARIAEPAGIGNTALYHYFESKTHCLFTLLQESYEGWYEQWRSCLAVPGDPVDAILSAVSATFQSTETEATKHRLLLHEQGKLSTFQSTGRTKQAQSEALSIARRIEKLWIGFLTDAMAAGAIPQQDPVVLAHAIIGLLQSIWGWYRPSGRQKLRDLETVYRGYVRAMVFAA
jgi:AcrR family transcriptional regulator